MPVTVEEKFGRLLSDRSAELTYIVRGTDDDGTARSNLAAAAPASHGGLNRDEVEVEQISNDLWLGTARYVEPNTEQSSPPQTGESSFSFSTTGGTQHITQSKTTVGSYGSSGSAPDHRGAIGVTPNSVEGCDIVVPVYSFSETHYIDDNYVDQSYKNTLFALTGKVNTSPFKGLAAGECLFLGAEGSQRGDGSDWEISFRFAGSPNVTGLSINGIGPITKKGWDYLWVQYRDEEDTTANAIVKRPVAVYVEQVYDTADFSALGIGT